MADSSHIVNRKIAISQWTSSSAVADSPRDAQYLSVVSFNSTIPRARSYIITSLLTITTRHSRFGINIAVVPAPIENFFLF